MIGDFIDGRVIISSTTLLSGFRFNGIVVRGEEKTPERLVLDLLLSLGYVSGIRILDGRDGEKADGYQIHSGEGRVYALKGKADEF